MKLRIFLTSFCAAIFMFLSCSRNYEDTTNHYPPAKPQGLAAVANNPNEITVSWEKSADASYYYLYESTDYFGEYSFASSLYMKIYDNKKTVAGLLSSTKYYFKLVSGNIYGTSDTSDIVSQKTLIDAPKNLKATFLPVNELVLEWDKVVDNETVSRGIGGNSSGNANNPASNVKYNIYLSQNPYGEYSFVNETNETRMKLLNLDDTKTYYCKVSAVDSDEREGVKSDYVSASILGNLPSVPQGLAAEIDNSYNGNIVVKLTWNSVNDADEYKVYHSTQPQISYDYYAPTKNNSMTVGGLRLKAKTMYYFKVSAVNSNGESEKSQEVSVQTPPM